ncbi:MAG: UDP-N-acetylmuramoyl-tripeptide--D-alanyl-D-alanine ligase [Pseudohongiellaceae bacterium]
MIPSENTLSALEELLSARLLGPDATFHGVSTDTRRLQPGELYVALRGEHFDGNAFIREAAAGGAAGAVVEQPLMDVELGQLQVDDGVLALGKLGGISRQASDACFLAITGSQGKTTVKEMAGAICESRAATLVTSGNLNNAIGVPLTLLRLETSHRYAVIELGASARGEIAETVALVQPDAALINNAAATHVEGFGSLDGVVEGKGEIIDGVRSGGAVVLNADDPAFPRWRERAAGLRLVTFSLHDKEADFYARDVELDGTVSRFVMRTPEGTVGVRLMLPGRHNVANALAAAALCHCAGIDGAAIARALETVRPVSGRLETLPGLHGSVLLDDSYNASPSSFRAAVDVLVALAVSRQRRAIVITGVMAELGSEAAELHRQAGAYARSLGVEELWALGPCSDDWCEGFGAGARKFASHEEIVSHAEHALGEDHAVLVKGSRSAAMDRIIDALRIKGDSF